MPETRVNSVIGTFALADVQFSSAVLTQCVAAQSICNIRYLEQVSVIITNRTKEQCQARIQLAQHYFEIAIFTLLRVSLNLPCCLFLRQSKSQIL